MIIAILHAHQTWPSRMQPNVLITKTRVITCICEDQSWWVCMMMWLTLDCALNICVAFVRVKFHYNWIIPVFLKLATKSFQCGQCKPHIWHSGQISAFHILTTIDISQFYLESYLILTLLDNYPELLVHIELTQVAPIPHPHGQAIGFLLCILWGIWTVP